MKYYYDRLVTKILPRNADVNLIIGARGLGKTYSIRKYMIDDYIKNQIRFVEVTRFREENNDVASNYFSRIIEDNLYAGYEFQTSNKIAQIRKKGEKKWETCGYFIPLSLQQQKKKSTFVNVRNICFDEIIIDTNDKYHHYLNNEYEQLANLIDTVTRERPDDKTLRKPRLFLLGNACDAFNPYFRRYNIPLNPDFGLKWYDNKSCLFDYVQDDAYATEKTRNTVAGRMLRNSATGSINSSNKFAEYSQDFVEKPHAHATNAYKLVFNKKTYMVVNDYSCGVVFITSKYDAGLNVATFAITTNDNSINYLAANATKALVKNLIDYYSYGYLRYDSIETQETTKKLLRAFGVK